MVSKSAVMCPTCGRTFKSPQGLAGHRRIKHAQTPKGAPPPRPVEREFIEKPSVREPVSVPEPVERESIYKPYPAQPWSATQPTYPQYSPQTQALPPAQLAQPPQPQQSVLAQPSILRVEVVGAPKEAPLTKENLRGLVEEAILKKIPAEAPPKLEVTFSDRIRQIFAEHRERKKKWDDEVIKPLKESTRQIHETADELFEKTKKLELSLMKGSEKQKIVPVPSEPPKIVEVVPQVEKPSPPPQQAKAQAEAPSSAQVPRVAEQQTPSPPQRPSEPPAPLVTPRPQPTPAEPPKVQQVEKLPASPTEPPKVQPEVSPAQTPEAPAEQQAPLSPQPAEPPMSLGDTILMSKRLARESATREVKKLLEAEEARKAGAEKEVKAHEEGEEGEKEQKEEGQKEGPKGETLEPPEEEPQEEPLGELPQRRGIFPVFRRRRFRLLR